MGKAKKEKSELKLGLGDLVLAKVKGYPFWPAKISRPEDWDQAPVPRKYFVYFFGTRNIAFVAPADIQVFTNEVKEKLVARCKAETNKTFAPAVNEICQAYEQLHRKESASSRDALCKSDVNGETGSTYNPTFSTAATAATAPPADRLGLMLTEAKLMHHCTSLHDLSKIIFKERAEMRSRLINMESQVREMKASLDLSKSETRFAVSSLEKERCDTRKRFADFEKEKVDFEAKRLKLAALGTEVVVLKERVQYLESSLAESVREKNEAVKAHEEADRVHREVQDTMAREMIRLKEAHAVEKMGLNKENIGKMTRNEYVDALKQARIPYNDPVSTRLKFPYFRPAPCVTRGEGVSFSSSVPVTAAPISSLLRAASFVTREEGVSAGTGSMPFSSSVPVTATPISSLLRAAACVTREGDVSASTGGIPISSSVPTAVAPK